jgi:PAS domain S-box-containing protein
MSKGEQRREAEAADLPLAERRLHLLLAYGPGMIYSLDNEQFRLRFLSENVVKMLGYEASEFRAPGFWLSHLHPEDRPGVDAAFAALQAVGHHIYEYRFLHADGRYRWMLDEMNLLPGIGGKAGEVFGVWLERTEQREVEIGFRAVFESVLEAILVLDDEGRFVEMNPAARMWLSGQDAGELLGRSHPELAEDPDQFAEVWQTLRREGRAWGEMRLYRPDGKIRDAEYYGVANYLPGRHLVVLRDVTDRNQARMAEARLARILDFTPNVVAMMQLDLTLVYLNRSARRILGVTEDDDVSGLRLLDFPLARRTRETLETGLRTALESGAWSGESVLPASDGTEAPYLLQVVAHPGARPEERLLSLIGRDIVELKRSEHELRQAKEEAERANRAKTEFLSQISHELRTPLSSILGFSEMLADTAFGTINAQQKQFLDNVLSSSQHLLSLINDLLDLVKVESGRIDLQLADVELGSLIADIAQAVREQARQAGLDLRVESLPRFPPVAVDLRRFKQMLLNLLSNAIKFTPRGGSIRVVPEVRATIRPQPEEDLAGPWLCIQVIDSGIGIGPDDQAKLFQPFVQIINPARGFQPGTGLGLVLSRRLAEQHGGHLWVESEGEQKGSTFIIALPLRSAASADGGEERRPGGAWVS